MAIKRIIIEGITTKGENLEMPIEIIGKFYGDAKINGSMVLVT